MPRNREFDHDQVVRQAMTLFWERGFRASSYAAIEQATGLNRSSLYNSFGSKAELFGAALDAYSAGPCAELHRPLREQHGTEAINAYLDGLRTSVRSRNVTMGCLMLNTSLEGLEEAAVALRVRRHFSALHAGLQRAFHAGLADGALDAEITAKRGADYLLTVVRGVLAGAIAGEKPSVLSNALSVAKHHIAA